MKIDYIEDDENNAISISIGDSETDDIKSFIKVFVYDCAAYEGDHTFEAVYNNKTRLYIEGTNANDDIYFYIKTSHGGFEHDHLFHEFNINKKDASFKRIYKTIHEQFIMAIKHFTMDRYNKGVITKNKEQVTDVL